MKIGILGGGQLGRMFLQNALSYPYEYHIMDSTSDAPSALLAHHFVQGDITDFDAVLKFGQNLDVIGIEIEHVNTEALRELKKRGKTVIPDPDVLATIQDKGLQKQFFDAHQLPTAPYRLIEKKSEIDISELPKVQKMRTGGYDGKGVVFLKDNSLDNAFDAPSVIEQAADIKKELSVIVCRDQHGNTNAYPVVEQVFNPEYNLLDYLLSPAQISDQIAEKATQIAMDLVHAFDQPGIYAVELFYLNNEEIWINEVAPRVHNSGHASIEGNFTSQFDQMLRILAGLPLGNPETKVQNAIVNLIGENNHTGKVKTIGLEKISKIDNCYLHLYGKTMTKPGRKMGHITLLHNDLTILQNHIHRVKESFKIIAE